MAPAAEEESGDSHQSGGGGGGGGGGGRRRIDQANNLLQAPEDEPSASVQWTYFSPNLSKALFALQASPQGSWEGSYSRL